MKYDDHLCLTVDLSFYENMSSRGMVGYLLQKKNIRHLCIFSSYVNRRNQNGFAVH